MYCRHCYRDDSETTFIPKHWKKGCVCEDCNKDFNRLANRLYRNLKKKKINNNNFAKRIRREDQFKNMMVNLIVDN